MLAVYWLGATYKVYKTPLEGRVNILYHNRAQAQEYMHQAQ